MFIASIADRNLAPLVFCECDRLVEAGRYLRTHLFQLNGKKAKINLKRKMDSQPPLETVVQALNALYQNPDASGKEKASLWLGELQKSVSTFAIWHSYMSKFQVM